MLFRSEKYKDLKPFCSAIMATNGENTPGAKTCLLSEGSSSNVIWMTDAEKELRKIPFFVRGKAKRNTERYAADNGVLEISIDTLYEAKAHYAR